MRRGVFTGTARTQAQLAVSADGSDWVLLNASPDLHAQIESAPELWPYGERQSPIRAVVLTGGEIDQIAGLLVIREFQRFDVFSTPPIRRLITEENSVFKVLSRVANQVAFKDIQVGTSFTTHGLRVDTLPLPGYFPLFAGPATTAGANPDEAVIGLFISPEAGGETVAFLPGVGSVSDALLERLRSCSLIFFDGTFWTDLEPQTIPGIVRTARQMGHLPNSGTGGAIERLAGLPGRKIFLHINNTNPILDEQSKEHRTAIQFGWEVARDGMEMTL
jgi:pyrroloquinoline quinone biosynthesis protein B